VRRARPIRRTAACLHLIVARVLDAQEGDHHEETADGDDDFLGLVG